MGAGSKIDAVPMLIKDMASVRGSECELRKWYVVQLAKLDDARILPALKREEGRKGNVLDILSGSGDLNACMQNELKQAIDDRQ